MHGDARTRVRDGWLPALLLVIGATELATLRTPGWPWAVALEAVGAALLVFRRTHPLVAVPGSAAAVLLVPLTGTQMNEAAAPILFYVVGVFSLGRFATALPGASAVVAVLAMVFADYALVDPRDHDVTDVVFVLTLAVPPYVFGRIVRKLDEHGRQLVEQQEVIRRQAVQAERDRIARELHDVIAHSVSAMVVQTAAAQDLVRSAPDRAAALLETVAETGRAALAETGRLLHLVRDDADELGLRPAPGLADLPALVASLRDGGMRLDAELELPKAPVPAVADVSAYRLVQEALTNALKYTAGTVRLRVSATGDELRIWCANPVNGSAPGGSGLGLVGMEERVAVLGGTLRHGLAGDRFEVDAAFPLRPGPTA